MQRGGLSRPGAKRKRGPWRFETLGGATPYPAVARPRHSTLSVALPASILENAQSQELRCYLVGQIARALAIYEVDEVVLWDDAARPTSQNARLPSKSSAAPQGNERAPGQQRPSKRNAMEYFARVLQYAETPQYLRRQLVPMHPDLRFAGLLNPLDAPHHLRQADRCPFREGVVLNKDSGDAVSSLVNCGLPRPLRLDRRLEPGMRVTVRVTDYGHFEGSRSNRPKGGARDKAKGRAARERSEGFRRDTGSHNWSEPRGEATSPDAPREELGLYWGYQVRVAGDLGGAVAGCPWEGGYDLLVGTSEKGSSTCEDADFSLQRHRHGLVVFGGLDGIESAVEEDEQLSEFAGKAHEMFDRWVNTCPSQGSRTIRTEEALLISLAKLHPFLRRATADVGMQGG